MVKILKYLIFGTLILLFIFVSGKLFFEKETAMLFERAREVFQGESEKNTLRIGFSQPLTTLNPASAERQA